MKCPFCPGRLEAVNIIGKAMTVQACCDCNGIWFDSDDVMDQYRTYTYDANGNSLEEIFYDNVNGTWFDGDDVIDRIIFKDRTDPLRVVEYEYDDHGPDLDWFTYADNIIKYCQ